MFLQQLASLCLWTGDLNSSPFEQIYNIEALLQTGHTKQCMRELQPAFVPSGQEQPVQKVA